MMSTCPEADLFSVYLDNELPKQYCDDLQNHIESCDSCKNYFNKLKATKKLISSDSTAIQYTQMEDGFARLQARKSYAFVVAKTKRTNENFTKWAVPMGLAAAVLAIFVLPLTIISNSKQINSNVNLNTQSVLQGQQVSLINETGIYKEPTLPAKHIPAANYDDIIAIDVFRPELNSSKITMYIQQTSVSEIQDFVYNTVSKPSYVVPIYLTTDVYK